MVRIGVVADTHCPEFLDELPPRLLTGLRDVDLIVHAGDVGGDATLDRLRAIAPVEAVRGDHDGHLQHLPLVRQLSVGGRTIAIIHGNRSHLIEEPVTLLGTLSLGRVWPDAGLQDWLCRRFPEADVIVYGHTHRARADLVKGKLLFNPGAVYMVDGAEARRRLDRGPSWFEWCWLQVIRHRRDRLVASFGLLEIGDRIRAQVHPLR
ncbi:MAG TPA: metallophosphoesterase family protein [Candidatus Dormibacteraeota bacterium]|nr:metallophosphoesterase family protein [Candidatus Dormibacteraeota bacterium]